MIYDLVHNEKLRYEVAQNMIDHGGSFVHHLGQALMHADADNRLKVQVAFEDYVEQYHPKQWSK